MSIAAHPVVQPALPSVADASLRARVGDWRRRLPSLPLPGRGETRARWQALATIAADDVCAVKILEAHYDAIAILAELGEAEPDATGSDACDHADAALLAVWAAEPPDARLVFSPGPAGCGTLDGIKAWCSGASLADAALVTAHEGDQRVLVRVVLAQSGIAPLGDDWQAVGMARVDSGRLSFQGAQATRVGAPGAYLARPGFWHGGAGIAACWFGAAAAIAETLRVHPRAGGNAHAMAHLGAIDMALTAAASLLRETAATIDAAPELPHIEAVTRVRSVVERTCSEVIDRVGRALGPAPLCQDGAHARRCADLTTFLRQSHAERDWATLGAAAQARENTWTL